MKNTNTSKLKKLSNNFPIIERNLLCMIKGKGVPINNTTIGAVGNSSTLDG